MPPHTGLGALNWYWVIFGGISFLMNASPMSLDCSAAMETFLGTPGYTCNEVETFLNLGWCLGLSSLSAMSVVIALLPKIKPYAGNYTVMLAVSVVGAIFLGMQMLLFTMVPPKPTPLAGMMVPFLVFLGVAFVVHKEPKEVPLM